MVYEPMDMNQQIHSMKSKVSSIDLHALASTVRSMTEDLTSRGNVVINDSKRLYGIIDHCLTRSPSKNSTSRDIFHNRSLPYDGR